ncbi:hypothetical protein AA958_21990 [Streptomyces sp. CNQ-509]|uniref:hypothetical protein n=1 Tax=unclassified Streptomyces TaxID=2593676 RepID=UPI00062E0402|nr:hypothetical protein [Streptomyces sp. CNQ-509]AKH84420.1 hypothetical protein AA958_21990 [Streptomyces sp. CNQ-509]
MVDDRYGWLDEDVAERLLRGEPLDFADGNGRRGRKHWSPEDRAAAERLAAVLARVAESGRPDANGRMPGEQAALAAFRAAQESPSPASAAEFAAESPFDGRRGRHRSGVVARLRSLRLSVVGAVAACALGGVAVASSAGVLPSPSFIQDTGGNRSPSVGATSSAEPPGGEKENGSAPEDGKGSDKDGKDKDSGKDGKDSQDHSRGTDTDLPGRGVIGDVRGNEPPNMADADAVLDQLCRDYLAAQAGTGPMPGQQRLRVLEQAAGSPAAMASYCSNRLGTSVGTPGGATGGTGGSSGGSTGGASEEPTSPSPSPTDPGTDPGGSTGGSSGSGGETGGGDPDGGSENGGSEGPPQEGPSSNPSANISESPAPEPSATATVAEPEETVG